MQTASGLALTTLQHQRNQLFKARRQWSTWAWPQNRLNREVAIGGARCQGAKESEACSCQDLQLSAVSMLSQMPPKENSDSDKTFCKTLPSTTKGVSWCLCPKVGGSFKSFALPLVEKPLLLQVASCKMQDLARCCSLFPQSPTFALFSCP